MRIIKLHGTSGAGKSTVAYELMERGRKWTCSGKGIEAYRIEALKSPLFILGKYETACGGMDTLNADQQIELIHKYAPYGHVFYEGLLASEYYGRLGAASEVYPDHVFAFLDTPVEVCVERVKARREAKGTLKPFNPDNTVARIDKIRKLQMKLERMGRMTVTVPYQNATDFIWSLYVAAETP